MDMASLIPPSGIQPSMSKVNTTPNHLRFTSLKFITTLLAVERRLEQKAQSALPVSETILVTLQSLARF